MTAEAVSRHAYVGASDEKDLSQAVEFAGPRSQLGDTIPFIFGTLEQRSPLCIYGGLVTEENPFTEPDDRKQFRSTLDLILCERVRTIEQVSVITLRKIWYDGNLLWDGTGPAFTTPVTSSGSLLSFDPNVADEGADPGGGYTDPSGLDRVGANGWWGGGLCGELTDVAPTDWGDIGIIAGGSLVDSIFHGRVLGWYTKVFTVDEWTEYLGLERIWFHAGGGDGELPSAQIGQLIYDTLLGTSPQYVYPTYHKFARLVFSEFCWGDQPKIGDISAEVTVTCPAPAIGDDLGIMPNGLDVNPVSLLYTLLTHPDFCGGPKLPGVDTDSFSAARATIEAEGMGASLRLEEPGKAAELVETLLEHVDGILFIDPATGLIRLTLNRAVEGAVPRFDESHVLSIDELSKTTWAATYSQCRVKFEMRNGSGDGQGADNVAVAKDPALALNNGLVETIDRDISTVYDGVSANKIAARLLAEANTPQVQAVAKYNRTKSNDGTGPSMMDLLPGDVYSQDYAPHQFTNLRLKVLKVDLGTLEDNAVTVTSIQDIAQAQAIIAPPEQPDNYTVVPPPEEVEIETIQMVTAPYLIAKAGIVGDARKVLTTRISPRFSDGEADTGDVPRAVNYDRFFVMARRPYAGATGFEWSLAFDEDYGGAHVVTKAVPYTPYAAVDGAQTIYPTNSIDIRDMDPDVAGLIRSTTTLAQNGSGVIYIAGNWFVVTSFTPDEEDPTKGTIGFSYPTLDTEVTQGVGFELDDGAAIFFCDLSSEDWMLARVSPLLASNEVWFQRYSSTVGDEIEVGTSPNHRWYQEPYGADSSSPHLRFTFSLRNIDSSKINIVTSDSIGLDDRANALLPPMRFQSVQIDPGDLSEIDTTGNFPVIHVAEGETSFALRISPTTGDEDEYSIFNPRESDGSFVEPRVQKDERLADLTTDFAEFVQAEDTEVPDRRAKLEVWYTFPAESPEGDGLKRAEVDEDRNCIFECEASGLTESVTLYVRQALWGDRTEAVDSPDVVTRLSIPRIITLPFDRDMAERSTYFDGGTSLLTASAAGSPTIPITSYGDFSFSASHAICMWIRPQLSGLAAPAGLVSRRNPATTLATGSTHYIKPDGRLGGYIAGLDGSMVVSGAHTESTSPALTDDVWQHVIFNYNGGAGSGSKWTFLVNGSSVGGSSIGDTIAAAVSGAHSNPMLIGGDETKYEGWIRDIAIYDQIITGADAVALYNGGALIDPRTVTSGGMDANLIGYLACGTAGDSTSLIRNLAGASNEYPDFAGTGVTFDLDLP